jgi:hypothetical protein
MVFDQLPQKPSQEFLLRLLIAHAVATVEDCNANEFMAQKSLAEMVDH